MRKIFLVLLLICYSSLAQAKSSGGSGGPTGFNKITFSGSQYWIDVPTTYQPSQAMPVLFALHGDEGVPDTAYYYSKKVQKTSNNAFILVTPQAANSDHCWYADVSGNEAYLDKLLAEIFKKYNVDLDRVWVSGLSGGACFLGHYAFKRADVFAAVVYFCGSSSYDYIAPTNGCKIPGRFIIGSDDFLYGSAQEVYNTFLQNGHEAVWDEIPNLGHAISDSSLTPMWEWIKNKTMCGTTTPDTSTPPSSGGNGTGSGTGTSGGSGNNSGVGTGSGSVGTEDDNGSIILPRRPGGTSNNGTSSSSAPNNNHPQDIMGCSYGGISAAASPMNSLGVITVLLGLVLITLRRRIFSYARKMKKA